MAHEMLQMSVMRKLRCLALPFWAAALLGQGPNFDGSMTVDLVHGPLRYAQTARRNPVERLKQRLAAGERLAWDAQFGYLPAVLRALQVPLSSQVLVFSKTSFQAPLIMPSNPRAIYFADDVYVGWVRGGDFVELSTSDAELGGVFYVIEQDPAKRPLLQRQDDCLQCHHAGRTAGVPGHMIRSVATHPSGMVITNEASTVSDHRSPFEERWGGWYVSGTHGTAKHRGSSLLGQFARFNPDAWPAPHSDLVALMVIEHQSMGHNYLARLNYETRAALDMHRTLLEMDKKTEGPWSESTTRRIDYAIDAAIRYLTFQDEAPLPAPIRGVSSFREDFSRAGRRDAKGRSLRDFDLSKWLFQYPLSFLVYSEALDALEPAIRERFWARLEKTLHSPALSARRGPEAWKIFSATR